MKNSSDRNIQAKDESAPNEWMNQCMGQIYRSIHSLHLNVCFLFEQEIFQSIEMSLHYLSWQLMESKVFIICHAPYWIHHQQRTPRITHKSSITLNKALWETTTASSAVCEQRAYNSLRDCQQRRKRQREKAQTVCRILLTDRHILQGSMNSI